MLYKKVSEENHILQFFLIKINYLIFSPENSVSLIFLRIPSLVIYRKNVFLHYFSNSCSRIFLIISFPASPRKIHFLIFLNKYDFTINTNRIPSFSSSSCTSLETYCISRVQRIRTILPTYLLTNTEYLPSHPQAIFSALLFPLSVAFFQFLCVPCARDQPVPLIPSICASDVP